MERGRDTEGKGSDLRREEGWRWRKKGVEEEDGGRNVEGNGGARIGDRWKRDNERGKG